MLSGAFGTERGGQEGEGVKISNENFRWDPANAPRSCKRDIAGTLSGRCRDVAGTLPGRCRDAALGPKSTNIFLLGTRATASPGKQLVYFCHWSNGI